MKDLITERFNGLTLEKWTILSFFALGYIVIYKYSFYATLGIPWYISSTSPLQIVFGSIKLVFYIVVSLIIITLIVMTLRKIIEKFIIGLMVRLALLSSISWLLLLTSFKPVLILKFNFLNNLFDLNYFQPFLYFMMVFAMIDIFIESYKYFNSRKQVVERINGVDHASNKEIIKMLRLLLALIFGFLIFVGSVVGRSEANYITENKEMYLSSAKIKDSKDNWFIIDYVGDKVLLIKDDSEKTLKNTFKIIEYKEIKAISSDKYIDEVKDKVNNKLKNYLGLQEN